MQTQPNNDAPHTNALIVTTATPMQRTIAEDDPLMGSDEGDQQEDSSSVESVSLSDSAIVSTSFVYLDLILIR